MAVQWKPSCSLRSPRAPLLTPSSSFPSSPASMPLLLHMAKGRSGLSYRGRRFVVRSSSGAGSGSLESGWQRWWRPPEKGLGTSDVSLSDVLWPSAGAFAAMALLGRLDQMVASRGLSFTIAPLGAVCAVLFTNPNAPAAQVRIPLALAQSLMLQIIGIQQSSKLLEEVTNSFGSHDHE